MNNFVMQKCIDNFQKAFFGIGMTEAKQKGMCVTCKDEAKIFSRDIYQREYQVSGMCEKCQRDVFAVPGNIFNPDKISEERATLDHDKIHERGN